MVTSNTLELARQGDPAAIAVILTYYLSQQWNAVATAIRLGDYLSVLIDANFALECDRMITLVLSILTDLRIPGLRTVDISVRQMGDREVQWSQTIELDSPTQTQIMTESTSPDWFVEPTPDSSAPVPADMAPHLPADASPIEPLPAQPTAAIPTIATPTIAAPAIAAPTPDALPPEALTSASAAMGEIPMAVVETAIAEPEPTESPAAIATPALSPAAAEPLSVSLIFQRPEIVALIAVAVVLVLWDSYVEWLNEPDSTEVLSKGKLARRLGVSRKVLDRVKGSDGFSQWSQELDPDGLAWRYDHPVFVLERSPLTPHRPPALLPPMPIEEG